MATATTSRPLGLALAGRVVAPGQRLCPASAGYAYGDGVYERGGFLYASVVGTVTAKPETAVTETEPSTPQGGSAAVVTGVVSREDVVPHMLRIAVQRRDKKRDTVVPKVGDVVVAKVVKITARFAKVEIARVEGKTLVHTTFAGMIRKLDVRATEVDKLKMHECFRPGDLIKAEVISLGTARSYFLSTAKNELGVFYALSGAGYPLVPVSWQEMLCSGTGAREPRKVAKVGQ